MHHHPLLTLALAFLNSSLASATSASASPSNIVIIPVNSAVQTAQLDIMSGMPMLPLPALSTSTPLAAITPTTPAVVATPTPTSSPITTSTATPANTTTKISKMSTVVMPSMSMSMSMPGMNTSLPTVTGGAEGRSIQLLSIALGVLVAALEFA